MNPRRCQTGNDRSVRVFAQSIGGLRAVSYYGAATTNCFRAFDGKGNVMALVNAADGTSLANYAYGLFGELIQQTGVMARNNPIRFSTKYQHDESDLLYYGHRYYQPSLRWQVSVLHTNSCRRGDAISLNPLQQAPRNPFQTL